MGFSTSAVAALLVLPVPSSSSSDDTDDSDDAKIPPLSPAPDPKVASPPPQQQQQQQQKLVRQWLDLERDCNVAMKALARAGEVAQVADLFAELADSARDAGAAAPSVLSYNTLLNAVAEAGLAAKARKVFDGMLAEGVAPTASTFNILVKLYAWRTAEFHLAYAEIHGMRAHGVAPDVGTFSTLVTGLCRARRLDEAWGVLDWMMQEGCLPMVHTYTPILQGYCREGRIEEARKLMDFMEGASCPPNIVTYNVLIKALCDDGRFDEVKEVLAELKTKGPKPSAVTYNTYMDALSKAGMAEKAIELFEDMRCEGLKPTAFTLSIVLDCFCVHSKFSEVICLLERTTELNWCAAVVAYNTVMSRLCDTGRWLAILELLADMIKKDIIPNTRTFNILIHSFCSRGKLSVAINLVFNHRIPANVVTYNTLIHWSYFHGRASDAYSMFEYMTKVANIAPDEVTCTIMVDGLCRQGKFEEATTCFKESIKDRLSKDLLTALINRLGRKERIRNILDILEKIKIQGFVRNHLIFEDTVRSFCRVGFCQYTKIFNLEFLLEGILGPGKEVYPAHKIEERDK